ncbi:potassium channel family protein [Georgenia satyanarayanai]|uniref:potassium channel family protein n=1 Tax=Georgenia satyanarayanai TaxID=860221 RepID=UPI00186B4E2E|nr:potassium channel family protein [Georgenia satyanarayanai]
MSTLTDAWERRLNLPLTVSTVLFLVAYAWPILEPDLGPAWRQACSLTVWTTWALLGVDFVVRLWLATDRWQFLRRNPLDLATLLLPLLRPLRLLRLVTLLTALNRYAGSSLRGKVGVYLVGSVSLLCFVAALAVLDAERGGEGPIQTFGDALWWSATTVTTVGYGDMFPITATGRLVAVALMVGGIATVGVVTASLASWLIDAIREEREQTSPQVP